MKNDKYVILMPGGIMQYPALEYLKKNNYKVIIFDGSEGAALREHADIFINVDIFDKKECLSALNNLSKTCEIVSVVTLSADCHATVALMASILDAPLTWNGAVSEICLDKFKTRQFLRDICYQPSISEIDSFSDIKKLSAIFANSPVVLKAPDSSGSRGFQAFDEIGKITERDVQYTKQFSKSGKVIVEAKLERTEKLISEISVEALWHDGECKVTNIVDRVFIHDALQYKSLDFITGDVKSPGIEVGHFNPSFLPSSKMDDIRILYNNIFESLPMAEGLRSLKLDLLIDENDQVVVLEMTPRSSGGWDSCFSNIAIGGNVQRVFLDYCLGRISEKLAYDEAVAASRLLSRSFVLGIPEADASNCIGRVFYNSEVFGLDASPEIIVASAVEKFKKGEKLETLPIR